MNPLEKLIALNSNILKIDVELFNNIFTSNGKKLELQNLTRGESQNTITNNNIVQQLSEKILFNARIVERFVSSFRENINSKILTQKTSNISNNFQNSEQLNSISQLPNVESTTLHTPTSINRIFTKKLEENSIRGSNTSSTHSTNIHIDKVEINDVSNVNDLALQLQQKVSTL